MASLRQRGRRALVAYIVAGDGGLDLTLKAMHALVEAGADVLELGIPFSDPMAEGPPIQRGMERALELDTRTSDVLELVASFRLRDAETPVVLMGYANSFLHFGYDDCRVSNFNKDELFTAGWQFGYNEFTEAAVRDGADGALVVDMPVEDAKELSITLANAGLSMVFLVSPTTADERLQAIARMCRGYLYCVSLKGVTGADSLDMAEVEQRLRALREQVSLPLCVGFGIKTPDIAARLAKLADGVVLGSLLVDTMGRASKSGDDHEQVINQLQEVLQPFRQAIDKISAKP